jgi:dynein assembly factor 3
MKREVRGFFLDLANSPYAAFGIAPLGGHGALGADDEHEAGLYEIQNKGTGTEQHRHNTTEVAMYNMISMLSEIETGEAYAMSKPHDLFSGLGGDATDVVQAAAGKGAGTAATKDAKKLRRHAAQRAKTIVETLTDFKLVLHSGDLPAYLAKPRHRATFHRGHISSKSVGLCEDAAAMGCFKPGAPVSVETAKTLFVLDDKLVKAYEDSVCGKAKDRGWVRGPGDEYRWDFTLPAAPAEPPVAVADEPVVLD